jgi:hypothetical protein
MTLLLIVTLLSSLTAIAIFVVTRNREPEKLYEILKEWGKVETAFNDGMMNRMAYLEKLIKSMSGEIDSISKHNLDLVVSVIAVNGHIKTSKERWNYLCDKIGQPELKYNEEDQTNKMLSLEPFDYSGVGSDLDIREVCGVKEVFFKDLKDNGKGRILNLVKYVEQNSTTANELAFGMFMTGKVAAAHDFLTSKHEQYE